MAIVVLQDGVPVNRKRKKSFVYAARISNTGDIKIGVSGNLQQRMDSLRAERGSVIELIGVIPGAQPDEKRHHHNSEA